MNRALNSTISTVAIPAVCLALVVVLTMAGGERADGAPVDLQDETSIGAVAFDETGQFIYSVPAGVRGLDVEAIGGKGADKGLVPGGRPARVTGRIDVVPGNDIYVFVAGSGSGVSGGFNGGGDAAIPSPGGAAGGGGGGASDIRTVPPGSNGTLESRLAVAAGGGGAGSTANGGGKAGGAGGNVAVAGGTGASAGPANTIATGGTGGGVGDIKVGGQGGAAGGPLAGPSAGQSGATGSPGSLAFGGNGGSGPSSTNAGGGGGGGGGLFGGGGGGGGGTVTTGTPTATGGGGGGGGSAFVPAGGGWEVQTNADGQMVKLNYTIPGTAITAGPAATINTTSATFRVESTEADSSFECSLDGLPFALCAATVRLTGLGQGQHDFRVRAINSMDNFDTTPATWGFSVDSIAPVTKIYSGPHGSTRIRRPEFRFRSTEPDVTFSCRFDGDPFAACAEPGAEIPPDVLGYGPHTFAVRATDTTGNVGPAATRSFEVIDAVRLPDPQPIRPPRRTGATMKIGRFKADARRGTALLKVKVSAPGKVILRRSSKIKRSVESTRGPATIRLKVAARGKARKALRRKRKLVVLARIIYRPAAKNPISRKKRVTLKLAR